MDGQSYDALNALNFVDGVEVDMGATLGWLRACRDIDLFLIREIHIRNHSTTRVPTTASRTGRQASSGRVSLEGGV